MSEDTTEGDRALKGFYLHRTTDTRNKQDIHKV